MSAPCIFTPFIKKRRSGTLRGGDGEEKKEGDGRGVEINRVGKKWEKEGDDINVLNT